MIVGGGPCAVNIAENLIAESVHVIVAVKEDSTLEALINSQAEILLKTRITGCKGFVGKFNVSMDVDGETVERPVSNIIVAEEDLRKPRFSEYGLTPNDSVVGLSGIMAEHGPAINSGKGKTLVFITGVIGEGNPVITADVMRTCLKWQTDLNVETYILTRNLKVGANGLEKLYRETKEAGTVYIKFTDDLPHMEQDEDGKVTIFFQDEITQKDFRLTPDIAIIDEDVLPSGYLGHLADIFRIDTDPSGFLQTDNVHRLNVLTNRKGIMVAGSSRGILSYSDKMIDAANAAITSLELFEPGLDQVVIRAEISAGKCVRCLTCLRICPHGAVRLNTSLSVVPEACEGCGICTAECPKDAIRIDGFGTSDVLGDPEQYEIKGAPDPWVPVIIAFCCTHSAARAWALSSQTAKPLPPGLKVIEIPCGGMVSLDYIFSALRAHADGVLVLTCHEGNCNSEQGNVFAKGRVDGIAGLLSQMGFARDRLAVASLASNMGTEFSDMTLNFERRIAELGPSKIKTS